MTLQGDPSPAAARYLLALGDHQCNVIMLSFMTEVLNIGYDRFHDACAAFSRWPSKFDKTLRPNSSPAASEVSVTPSV